MQTLFRWSYSLCVQSHELAFVGTLKKNIKMIPLLGHTKILQTLIGMGSAALGAAKNDTIVGTH